MAISINFESACRSQASSSAVLHLYQIIFVTSQAHQLSLPLLLLVPVILMVPEQHGWLLPDQTDALPRDVADPQVEPGSHHGALGGALELEEEGAAGAHDGRGEVS